MKDIDREIRELLDPEDAKRLDEVGGEPSLLELVADSFRGRSGWLVVMVFVFLTLYLALAVVSVIQFFHAGSPRAMIGWAFLLLVCLIAIGMLKMWYWMELNKHRVLREMKVTQLMIARMGRRLESKSKK